jgi:putative nucleotidyltransferase-like protein
VYLGRVAVQSYEFGPPVSAPVRDIRGNFDLLLEYCAVAIGTADRIQSRRLHDVDWEAFADLAERHDVLPLVYRSLHREPNGAPHKVLEAFRRRYERNARKNLRLAFELTRILECLSACGVDAIPYKGPVLAEILYGDVGLRQFSDLDILIRPRDLTRASAAVQELGYKPTHQLTRRQEQACMANGYERAFDGPLGKNLLEVQWRIVPKFYSIDLEVEDLFERSSSTALDGWQGRTLSPEDLLLVLCVHAAKHSWVRLSWLCDMARTLQTQTMDFEVVRSRTTELGITRIVGISVGLANRLLKMPVPAPLDDTMGKDERVAQLGEEVRRLMIQPSEFDVESADYFRLMVRARERRRDQLHFLARLAFTPSTGEWSAIRLPGPLFSLYRIVRIARLSSRALSEVFAHNG